MPSDLVFLDSSGWIALLNSRDDKHSAALAAWREVFDRSCRVVVTDWIIAETGNGLAKSALRRVFAGAVHLVMQRSEYHFVMIDQNILDRAVELYASRPDKGWGMVDCASFVVMDELGAREAMTADHHFEQAGFRRLLVHHEQQS